MRTARARKGIVCLVEHLRRRLVDPESLLLGLRREWFLHSDVEKGSGWLSLGHG